jgi:uncharacterized phage protein (TIGR01671 family)
MKEIKFDVIFFDGSNKDTIEHYSAEEAISEGFIEFKNNELKPTDECTIIREYTGLKDKNGKEIYEGDIVSGLLNGVEKRKLRTFKIIWSAEYLSFIGINVNDDSQDIILNQWELEVIGNIFENGELLK